MSTEHREPFQSGGRVAHAPAVFVRLSPAVTTEVYDTYWRFAAERQCIFFKRLRGAEPPWTDDLILRDGKFTNAYRASDRVSQYLIRHVIYAGDQSAEEVFFRTLLFKIFNRIETWEALLERLGAISYSTYSFDRYGAALGAIAARGVPIFSAAYIMPSGGTSYGCERKYQNYLKLLEHMMIQELPSRVSRAKTMRHVFEYLHDYPMMGDFLAYQYAIDLNYSTITDFSESEFVMPGPGARDGIHKCFANLGGLNEMDIIKVMMDRQEIEFERLGIKFLSLWGRRLQLIDCQNLFCEVGKYARLAHPSVKGISGRVRIKQRYRWSGKRISCWYPPKWNINDLIESEVCGDALD